ncbi:hypothetical protein KCP70_08690 [Salmonella enterica subsp. enterica]|nr:hypothetical protein KCP70_08690 [Salmonella enterica subsp. enterica]
MAVKTRLQPRVKLSLVPLWKRHPKDIDHRPVPGSNITWSLSALADAAVNWPSVLGRGTGWLHRKTSWRGDTGEKRSRGKPRI